MIRVFEIRERCFRAPQAKAIFQEGGGGCFKNVVSVFSQNRGGYITLGFHRAGSRVPVCLATEELLGFAENNRYIR